MQEYKWIDISENKFDKKNLFSLVLTTRFEPEESMNMY